MGEILFKPSKKAEWICRQGVLCRSARRSCKRLVFRGKLVSGLWENSWCRNQPTMRAREPWGNVTQITTRWENTRELKSRCVERAWHFQLSRQHAGRVPEYLCVNCLLPLVSWERAGPEARVSSTIGIYYTPTKLFFFFFFCKLWIKHLNQFSCIERASETHQSEGQFLK